MTLSTFSIYILTNLATEQLEPEESVFIEHIVVFNENHSFIIPIVTLIDRPYITADFEVGAKYRIYFYLVPGELTHIDTTRIELIGNGRQSVDFVLSKHSRKRFDRLGVYELVTLYFFRYTQNCEDYEVFCYECGGDDIQGVCGGRISSRKGLT